MERDGSRPVSGYELATLRSLLSKSGVLQHSVVRQRSWIVGEIDDKSLFGSDAENIGSAFRVAGISTFLVVSVTELLSTRSTVLAHEFMADKIGIEAFQSPDWYALNLDDCVLFTLPMTGIVVRPGEVDTTYIAGPEPFVNAVLGRC
ncbi:MULTISPECIES: hypothetical protein [unclassified Cupriavidus]|uniref:hypothetical protein n=1 Tax=unclassified Cupriavidus TaxID=2640874 RepID=UPI00313F2520